jgi:hypothetical protein
MKLHFSNKKAPHQNYATTKKVNIGLQKKDLDYLLHPDVVGFFRCENGISHAVEHFCSYPLQR